MVSFLLSFLFLFSGLEGNNDKFEGSIDLIQKSHYDVVYFTYYVKNENIRIDHFDKNRVLKLSLLLNLEKDEITVLNPNKKLYAHLNTTDQNKIKSDSFIILKTENSRQVNGFECYQWRVKNVDRNTEVTYWVSQNNFYFFKKLVELLNKADKSYEFFEQIPDTQGFFPILSIERTLLRREKSRLYVVDISNKSIDSLMFTIPKDYELVRH